MRSLRWIRGSSFARHEIGLYSDVRNAFITVKMMTPKSLVVSVAVIPVMRVTDSQILKVNGTANIEVFKFYLAQAGEFQEKSNCVSAA